MIGHPSARQVNASAAFLIVVALAATACIPDFGESVSEPVRRGALVTGNGQQYRYVPNGSSMVVYARAPWSNDGRLEAFWSTRSPFFDDQQICTTWNTTARSLLNLQSVQPGVALRIAPSGPDKKSLRAITLTERNTITLGDTVDVGISNFDVDLWDTSDTSAPVRRIASFDLAPIVGSFGIVDGVVSDTMVPAPWHVCARTLDDQFTFKVWTGDGDEPAWDDVTHVFTATLPPDWTYAGYAGSVVGSLHENQSATFSDVAVTLTCLAPDMIDTSACRYGTTTSTPAQGNEP